MPENTPLFLSWSFVRGSYINTGFPFPGNNFKTMQLFFMGCHATLSLSLSYNPPTSYKFTSNIPTISFKGRKAGKLFEFPLLQFLLPLLHINRRDLPVDGVQISSIRLKNGCNLTSPP